jgi:hypothetical protein
MGEYAEMHIEQYISGRFGIPMPKKTPVYPKTTKAAIAGQLFHIVEVKAGMGMKTNRTPGMKLVVCDNTEDLYWVWASNEVNGIRKDVCTVLEANLPLSEALARAGRKPYGPKPVKAEANPTDI